ncbi:MAG TPA: sulfatase-like hydrolase/transferase [Beijerinckiaceae bacterium]|nr:sulfatase-like hydrolase/transferase [Beijerinckiaceae bacterium]
MKAANTLVILSDEHQARALGCAGHPFVRTPNLDRLAARGMRFSNAVTPSPICVPARAAFATGQFVHRCGYWDNSIGYDGRVRGWGHALQEHRIPVESIGKLHYQKERLPTGFDAEHIPMHLYKGVGMVWASIRDPLPENRPTDKRMLGEYIGPGESDYTRYDQAVTDLAIDWLKGRGSALEAPWCLYVGLVAPHFPLVAPPDFFALYPPASLPEPKLLPRHGYTLHSWLQEHEDFWSQDRTLRDDDERRTAMAAYYGLTSWLDHNVGRLISALEQAGLSEKTRVLYASDHGDNLGARGQWGKSNLYRESVDIPLIMAGPDVAQGVCATPVSLLDLSVTILDSLGLDPATALPQADGRSLFALAREPADADRTVFSEYHAVGSNTAAYMLRRGRWKYHHFVRHRPELFDLATDPEETRDLAGTAECADVLADMERRLRAICDPEAVDRAAKRDQVALIERLGGKEAVFTMGKAVAGGTPPPKT